MEAGQIIAYSQLAVKENHAADICIKTGKHPAGKNVKAKLVDRKGEADLAVVTPDLTLKISRATGFISTFASGAALIQQQADLKTQLLASSHRQRHGRWSAEESSSCGSSLS